MRVYLDNCCLSRPFDEQTQDRIVLEAQAILLILERVRSGRLTMVSSSVLEQECADDPDEAKRNRAGALLERSCETVEFGHLDMERVAKLRSVGFGTADSFHLVAAETARCDVLLTTDDDLIGKSQRHKKSLRIRVLNPVDWLREVTP
jgi:predicted nucleic acid-binding protein